LKIGDLIKDEKLIKHVRLIVNQLLDEDPQLNKNENQRTKTYFSKHFRESFDWGQIG